MYHGWCISEEANGELGCKVTAFLAHWGWSGLYRVGRVGKVGLLRAIGASFNERGLPNTGLPNQYAGREVPSQCESNVSSLLWSEIQSHPSAHSSIDI